MCHPFCEAIRSGENSASKPSSQLFSHTFTPQTLFLPHLFLFRSRWMPPDNIFLLDETLKLLLQAVEKGL